MVTETLPTAFAPAERDSPQHVRQQADAVAGSRHLRELLDAVPTIVLILNDKRQIVYANEVMVNLLGLSDGECLLGHRPAVRAMVATWFLRAGRAKTKVMGQRISRTGVPNSLIKGTRDGR